MTWRGRRRLLYVPILSNVEPPRLRRRTFLMSVNVYTKHGGLSPSTNWCRDFEQCRIVFRHSREGDNAGATAKF
jgi:hypothetical protein